MFGVQFVHNNKIQGQLKCSFFDRLMLEFPFIGDDYSKYFESPHNKLNPSISPKVTKFTKKQFCTSYFPQDSENS